MDIRREVSHGMQQTLKLWFKLDKFLIPSTDLNVGSCPLIALNSFGATPLALYFQYVNRQIGRYGKMLKENVLRCRVNSWCGEKLDCLRHACAPADGHIAQI